MNSARPAGGMTIWFWASGGDRGTPSSATTCTAVRLYRKSLAGEKRLASCIQNSPEFLLPVLHIDVRRRRIGKQCRLEVDRSAGWGRQPGIRFLNWLTDDENSLRQALRSLMVPSINSAPDAPPFNCVVADHEDGHGTSTFRGCRRRNLEVVLERWIAGLDQRVNDVTWWQSGGIFIPWKCMLVVLGMIMPPLQSASDCLTAGSGTCMLICIFLGNLSYLS